MQLTRAVLTRGLGLIHLIGFAILVQQGLPLLGAGGIMPMARFLARLRAASESAGEAFWAVPSLFWLSAVGRAARGRVVAGRGAGVAGVAPAAARDVPAAGHPR